MLPGPMLALAPDLQRQLQSELRPDEQLVWAEQPLPRLHRRGGAFLCVFGLFFAGFSVFWMSMASGIPHGLGPVSYMPYFGIPFLLVGLGLVTAPVWLGRKARRIIYAITNRRAIIIEPRAMGGTSVHSFRPEALASIARTSRADGSGDLVFEQYTQGVGSSTYTVRRGFLALADVRRTEQTLENTLLAGRTRAV